MHKAAWHRLRPVQWPVRGTLTTAIVLLATLVAALAVVLTGIVAGETAHASAEAQERDQLARQAAVLSRVPAPGSLLLADEQRLAGSNGVRLAVVAPDGRVTGPAAPALTDADRDRLLSGRSVSATAPLAGRNFMVEAHPAPGGGAVVLAQPMTDVRRAAARMQSSLLLPMATGLVGAALAGALLARRIARPLASAAAVAHRLAAGERGLRGPEGGPAEAVELGRSLTVLDRALTRSENRQREFLLSVSHEIRTPLTVVKGYAEALDDGVVPAGELPAVGRTLLTETRRLDGFVSDLLRLARLEADDFHLDIRRTDLTALAEEAAETWSRLCARHHVDFRLEHPATPVLADTDGSRVRQIADGLLENALRVTPEGSPLVLALHTEGGHAVIQVRDGGPGLSDDDAAVAFERGVLRDRYRDIRPVGSGLGLAIAHRLTTRLGGTITANGRGPEGGACFTVTLPGDGAD
ncbi:HAMP domain-containing sensor histidine kinase [Streptomyces sp900105755]|uniref:Signal transduction histidine-protein kinase/phosphatase MprB n=1 Tax=Streptomyces sp. 900105755 TaxID=3154389 RepID=A0ABV1T8E8_9ACTN